jgi:hypothetical protein
MRTLQHLLVAVVVPLALAACADQTEQQHEDEHEDDSTTGRDPLADVIAARVGVTDGGTFRLAYEPNPDPLAQGPFSLTLTVLNAVDDSVAGDDVEVVADAWMPEHGHGMIGATPSTTAQGEGVFVAEGMNFIMGGAWELLVDVVVDDVTESAIFAVDVP